MPKNKRGDRFHEVGVGGRQIPVRLRDNAQARRIILRIDPETDGVIVTLPPGAADAQAIALVQEKRGWIDNALRSLPPKSEIRDGAEISVLGQTCVIQHDPADRSGVRRDDTLLLVSGDVRHLKRRVADWLKAEARRHIVPRVEEMAACLGEPFSRISVRDTRSRWGSCTPSGNLSFSWRLVMAPEEILDYVVAHEVSHLRHLNHGVQFWQTVASLGVDAKAGRAWLNEHGQSLMRVG